MARLVLINCGRLARDARSSPRCQFSLSSLSRACRPAFALRKELVNLKKACLRTFHDVDKVIEQLQRQDQYFFRDTSSGHVRGCVALAPLADAPLDLDAHRAEYESVCHCFQRARASSSQCTTRATSPNSYAACRATRTIAMAMVVRLYIGG